MEPKVGVGVFVLNTEGKFIIGKRKGSHGSGTWALPGGHLEFGESFETCAKREILEETGLHIRDVKFLTAVNNVFEAEKKHYVTVCMSGIASDESPQPKLLEPEKCDGWEWISWEELLCMSGQTANQLESGSKFEGGTLFLPLLNLIQQRPGFAV